jgi:DNA-binding MarR family transcriptional regulator
MDNTPTLRFDGCIATNIEEAYRHLEQVYARLIDPLGLSILEWYTLRALYGEDGVSASRLARAVCRHPSSMTALLDRMEGKNLLRREIDIEDRRSVRVFLTAQGRAYEPPIRAVTEQLGHLTDGLITPEQMATFQYVLSVLQSVPLPD